MHTNGNSHLKLTDDIDIDVCFTSTTHVPSLLNPDHLTGTLNISSLVESMSSGTVISILCLSLLCVLLLMLLSESLPEKGDDVATGFPFSAAFLVLQPEIQTRKY